MLPAVAATAAEYKLSNQFPPSHHISKGLTIFMTFPKRPSSSGYRRTDRTLQHEVPDYAATLEAAKAPERYVDVEDEGVDGD